MLVSFFNNEGVTYRIRHKKKINAWLIDCCRQENKTIAELNVVLCSDNQLLKINSDHLDHHYFTDIITFDHSSGDLIEGELYISIDRVKENAQINKVWIEHELCRIMVHGLLHLIGYNDKTKKEKNTMTSKEDYYLNQRSF